MDPIGPGPAAVFVIDSPRDESEMHVLATTDRPFGYVRETVVRDPVRFR